MPKTTLAKFFGSVLRRVCDADVTVKSQMMLVIRFKGGHPQFTLGPAGRELACYIPSGLPWTQLNFGQSEGQAEIEGREWGFYWLQPGEMAVILHSGEIDLASATAFVRAVAEHVAAENESEILLVGDSYVRGS